MHQELWAVPTMNMIASRSTEAQALELVRELLAKGWQPNELSLITEDDAVSADDLPPAITGDELARWAATATAPSVRQTA